jgi:hypothetical protein
VLGELEINAADSARAMIWAVPTRAGSLLQAALEHYRADAARPVVLAVTEARVAGSGVDTSAPTSMAGLNCAVSSLAWSGEAPPEDEPARAVVRWRQP